MAAFGLAVHGGQVRAALVPHVPVLAHQFHDPEIVADDSAFTETYGSYGLAMAARNFRESPIYRVNGICGVNGAHVID